MLHRRLPFIFLFLLLFLEKSLSIQNETELPIIPKPKSQTIGNNTFVINKCTLKKIVNSNPNIKNDINDLLQFYSEKMFYKPIVCNEENSMKNFQNEIRYLIINVNPNQSILLPDDFNQTDEQYNLSIVAENLIIIEAISYAGFVRGIESLAQLINPNTDDNKTYYIDNCPLYVYDYPSYKVRGLMIDLSRHFFQIQVLNNVINAMMYSKLNILHLHLSDDDSYPLESITFPDLTNYTTFKGNNNFYSIQQMKNLIYFAQTRAVHIIPEFDNPGHVRSVGNHPNFTEAVVCHDLINGFKNPGGLNLTINGGPPNGNLDPTMNISYTLVDGIINDILNIFNNSKYIHLGGDEVIYRCWDTRPSIKEYMNEHGIDSYEDLFSLYLANVRQNLTLKNDSKVAIYWVNSATIDIKYSPSDILQYWGNSSFLSTFLQNHPYNPIIISSYDFHYLDCGLGGLYGNGAIWCDPFKSWLMIYSYNLYKFASNSNKILGIIATSWDETTSEVALETKLFPRGISLGEILWSNITEIPDLTSITKRITAQSRRMRLWGIRCNAIGRQWCEDYPEICYANYHQDLNSFIF